jgi:hypothetical protein
MVPPIRRGRGWLGKVQLQECPRYRVFVIRAIHGVIHFLLFFANGTAYHQLTCKNLIGHNFATSADHPVFRPKVRPRCIGDSPPWSYRLVRLCKCTYILSSPAETNRLFSRIVQRTDVNYHFYKWF